MLLSELHELTKDSKVSAKPILDHSFSDTPKLDKVFGSLLDPLYSAKAENLEGKSQSELSSLASSLEKSLECVPAERRKHINLKDYLNKIK